MNCSYPKEDVTLLLKDITGQVEPESTQSRERQIQQGRHYSEMLPLEYQPSPLYLQAYQEALTHFSKDTAQAVGRLAHLLYKRQGQNLVLVSLARAGIPAGILLRRYLQWRFQVTVPHYAISIIRGRGIDRVAMDHLLSLHPASHLVFVDGWIGKGAILGELEKEMLHYPQVSPQLAVLADPANVTPLYGTQEDILIPSACLNATVSGLISRTFLREDIIGPGDFHGAVYYKELEGVDVSNLFLQAVEGNFVPDYPPVAPHLTGKGLQQVEQLAQEFGISNINLVKPGIGETTRVLLRRVPWKILVNPSDQDSPALAHILRLAQERGVEVLPHPMNHYKVCGLIRQLDDL